MTIRRWNGLASGRPCPARVNLARHPPPWDFAVSPRNTWVLVDAVGILITDDVGSDAMVRLMRRYHRAVARADARSATVTRNG